MMSDVDAFKMISGSGVEVGQVWKHCKGGVYYILNVGLDSEIKEPVVTYRDVEHQDYSWTRPLKMFIAPMKDGSFRFILVANGIHAYIRQLREDLMALAARSDRELALAKGKDPNDD